MEEPSPVAPPPEETTWDNNVATMDSEKKNWVAGRDFSIEAELLPLDLSLTHVDVPVDQYEVAGGTLLFSEAAQTVDTNKAYFSRIYRGGIHLRRLAPIKDLLVPSGPLSSFSGTFVNISNATVGAGVLGFGVVFSRLGIALAPFIALIVLVLQLTANSLMLRAAKVTEARSLSVLAFRTFKLPGSIILDIILIISSFGSLCAYMIIIADFTLPVALAFISDTSLLATNRLVAILAVTLVGVIPLSLRRSLNSLESFSLLSVALVVLIVIGVIALSGIELSEPPNPTLILARLDVTSIGALSTLFFAFSNSSSIIPIFIEMKVPTRKQFNAVSILSGAAVFVIYISAGAMTYAAFGDAVQSNLLNSFPVSVVSTLMRLGFLVTIVTTYPLVLFSLRLSVEHLFLGIRRQFTPLEFSACTLILVAGSFGVAVATSNVDIVFGLSGAVGFSLLSFTFPSVFYIKACGLGRKQKGDPLTAKGVYLFIVAILLACFGIGALISGVISWRDTYIA